MMKSTGDLPQNLEPADTEVMACPTCPTTAVATGTRIGRYVVLDRVGAGGMGTVYAAFDAELGRRVAIKVLRADARGAGARARLRREAQTMARLSHPNVLAVYDAGSFGDGVFVAMELIDGRDLRAWLKEPHPWTDTLAILKEAGRGLAAAHAAGIVHRDFKPENVLVGGDGRVVVADFGIARAHEPALTGDPGASSGPSLTPTWSPGAPLAETEALVGTVGYMPPERAFDRRDDPRSDQFSFAVTLYRALYGRSPFTYRNLRTYLQALLEPPRPPPPGARVPARIHAAIVRALSHDAEDRFESMTALLAALDPDSTRRRRGWVAGVCASVGGAALLALGSVLSRADPVVAHHAIAAAYDLPSPRACLEANVARAALPEAPAARGRVLTLRRTVAEVSALQTAARCEDALTAAGPALREARAVPDRRSEAQVLLVMGECSRELGDAQAAGATWQEGFAAAEAAGSDALAAVMAARIAFVLGDLLERPRDAERWLAIARGILEREGVTDEGGQADVLAEE